MHSFFETIGVLTTGLVIALIALKLAGILQINARIER